MSQPSHPVVTLENEYWQLGILPNTGASIAYLRARHNDSWFDLLRPTHPADYGTSGKTSSFIMAPWCNRIRDGKLVFDGHEYQLKTTPDDGTARHGDVRQRQWKQVGAFANAIKFQFTSADHENINFPFKFSATFTCVKREDRRTLAFVLELTNDDIRPFPCGFGFHPYFNRPHGSDAPLLRVPCDQQFNLVNYLAVDAPVPIEPRLDYRQLRPVEDGLNDVLTGCSAEDTMLDGDANQKIHLRYPASNLDFYLSSTSPFRHWLLYTPPEGTSVAIEPMTNVSDGFNLFAQGIADSGVIVLPPAKSATANFVITRGI